MKLKTSYCRQINVNVLYIFGFSLFILFIPISVSLRQLGIGTLFLAFLVDYFQFKKNAYSKKPFIQINKIIFILFSSFIFIMLINVLFISYYPSRSFEVFFRILWKAFPLFFIAARFVQRETDNVRYLSIIYVISMTIQGIDAMYQLKTGVSFISGDQITWNGRLSGTMGDPRVTVYVAIGLFAYFVLFDVLKEKFNCFISFIVTFCLSVPAVLFLILSKTRSAWFGAIAFIIFIIIFKRKLILPFVFTIIIIAGIFIKTIIARLNVETIASDYRWDYWTIGLKLLREKPFLGHGLGIYRQAFTKYGWIPPSPYENIGHPHNIYIQLLVNVGFIGTAIFLLFVSLIFYFGIKRYLISKDYYIILTLGACLAYLVSAFSNASFYLPWWLGLAMMMFGVSAGLSRNT